jgi:Flp pilus assembly protein TadD
VAHSIQHESQPQAPRRHSIVLPGAVVVAIVGSLVAFVGSHRSRTDAGRRAGAGAARARTQSGVNYVGDSACARCHAEIAESYRRHPMGRSLFPIAAAPPTKGGDAGSGANTVFTATGLEYSIEQKGERVWHREKRRDSSGRVIAENEAEVQFVIGSGRQGLTYLIERDGFLFQSPISWYAQKARWDLSPGYEKQNAHFERPVGPACLFCHANRVDWVPGTVGRYERPVFQGHAIGCERCHGPGEQHAAQPSTAANAEANIVNPGRLEPSLRDAVCEQCHLNGLRRVLRDGHRDDDYRPGLPFYQFWTVLEPVTDKAPNRFVGQVEQMHESRCYRASDGRLGCISCHDPHRLPAVEARVSYYRDRCLSCHADRGCTLPVAVRSAQGQKNDCAGCHMPRAQNSDVIHAATADHRILRRPAAPQESPMRTQPPRPEDWRVVSFHAKLMNEAERASTHRDIGVALCRDGREGARYALPLLDAALAAHPDDLTAWQAKGVALGQLGRFQEGLAAFRHALEKNPDEEPVLTEAAYQAAVAGQRKDAIAYWRRAIAIDPWRSAYHAFLAPLQFQERDWQATAESCRRALQLNPAELDARKLLVRTYLRLGNREAARQELDVLLGFDPPGREELLRSFASLRAVQ